MKRLALRGRLWQLSIVAAATSRRLTRTFTDKWNKTASIAGFPAFAALLYVVASAAACAHSIHGVHLSMPASIPFNVRAAIEFARFSSFGSTAVGSDSNVLFSPDREHFAILVWHGNVDEDVNVLQLLVFSMSEVQRFVEDLSGAAAPSGRVAAQIKARYPRDEIAHVKWISNSEIGFVAAAEGGATQAFIADVESGVLTQVTHHISDVLAFDASADRIVFYSVAEDDTKGDSFVSVEKQTLGATIEPQASLEKGLPVIVELYSQSRGGGKAKRISTPAVALRDDFQELWLSPSGRYVVSFAPATNWPSYWAEYRTPSYELFGFTADRAQADPTSPDVMLRTRYQIIDLATNTARPLMDAPSGYLSLNGTPPMAIWLPGERSVVVSNTFLPLAGESGLERRRRAKGPVTAEVEIDSGRTQTILEEPVRTSSGSREGMVSKESIVSFDWSERRQLLTIVAQHTDGTMKRVSVGRDELKWSRPKRLQSNESIDAVAVNVVQSLSERPRLYVLSAACACRKLLFDPNPNAERFAFGKADVYSWRDQNGLQWTGGLIYPPHYSSDRLYPLVVQTHGFSPHEFLIDGPSDYTTAFAAQPLASMGIVVLQIGSNPQAERSEQEEGTRYAEGIRSAIAQLTAEGVIDSKRVGVIGFSRTGWHVLHLVTQHPDLVTAVTMSDAGLIGYVAHLLSVNMSKDLSVQFQRAVGIDSNAPPSAWLGTSPIPKLRDAVAPIRLEAMSPDSLVATWEAYAVLKYAKRPVDLIYFPRATHVLFRPKQRMESQGGNVDWFRYWLQDYVDPSPTKVAQYIRWKALRLQRDALTIEQRTASKNANTP